MSQPIRSSRRARNAYRWYVVAVCTIAYVFSFIDAPYGDRLSLHRLLVRVDGVVSAARVGPAIFIRVWGFAAAQSGSLLGIVTLVASTGGVLASGWLNDCLRQHGRRDAPMLAGAIGGGGIILPIAWLPAASSLWLAVALFGVALFFASFPMPPSTVAIQLLAPNRMRSRIAAMFLFCGSLFGLALGSALVGALNDFAFGRGDAVTTSVAIVVGGSAVATAAVLFAGMRPFRASLGEP